jgi:hypothetical protein
MLPADPPRPWVCLSDPVQQQCLYGELIQVVAERGIAWLRPIILVEPAESLLPTPPRVWVDLRQGPDLLLPMSLVHPALDTDVLPFLSLVAESCRNTPAQAEQARYQLNQFIRRLQSSVKTPA